MTIHLEVSPDCLNGCVFVTGILVGFIIVLLVKIMREVQ